MWRTMSKSISRRQGVEGDVCFGMDFCTTRKVVRSEMEQWVLDVESGTVVTADP